jgi:transposase
MASKRKKGVSMHTAREILRLALVCGRTVSDIAGSCNVDRKTVSKYIARIKEEGISYSEIEELRDTDLKKILKNKRGRKLEKKLAPPDFEYIHTELKKKSVTRQILWEEYKKKNPNGYQRTQFFHHYKIWKKTLNPSMRQNHKAGEKMFVDYSGQTTTVIDSATGKKREVQIFVAVLGASNYSYAEATESQNLSDWIHSHVNAFRYFEGVTALVVPDNLKSGVTHACRYEPDINREYHEMAVYYNTTIFPARVRAPKDKSRAENGVSLVQRWILAALRNRTFFSLADLNQAIHELLEVLNNRPFKKLKGTRRLLFETIDRPSLKPLPQTPYTFAEWTGGRVAGDYHVELAEHFYSVPFKYVGKRVGIRYTRHTVEVFYDNRRIASHMRNDTPRESTSRQEHMPRKHQEYLKWTPGALLNQAKEIGEATYRVVRRILEGDVHSAVKSRSALGIIRLEKRYTAERLEAACLRAITINGCTYRSIESMLSKGLDRQEWQPEKQPITIEHENVRGEDYFAHEINLKPEEYPC